MTELKLYRLGSLLCLALALNSCRKDYPPKIELCQLDGFGGADCIERDGSVVYKTPQMLKNYISTNPEDQATFTAWCYQATTNEVRRYGPNFASHE
jgi:hypothetical protein